MTGLSCLQCLWREVVRTSLRCHEPRMRTAVVEELLGRYGVHGFPKKTLFRQCPEEHSIGTCAGHVILFSDTVDEQAIRSILDAWFVGFLKEFGGLEPFGVLNDCCWLSLQLEAFVRMMDERKAKEYRMFPYLGDDELMVNIIFIFKVFIVFCFSVTRLQCRCHTKSVYQAIRVRCRIRITRPSYTAT